MHKCVITVKTQNCSVTLFNNYLNSKQQQMIVNEQMKTINQVNFFNKNNIVIKL